MRLGEVRDEQRGQVVGERCAHCRLRWVECVVWDDEEVARDMLFAGEEDGGGRKPRSKGRWAPQQWTAGRRRKVNKVRASVTGPQLATRFLGANVLGYTPI